MKYITIKNLLHFILFVQIIIGGYFHYSVENNLLVLDIQARAATQILIALTLLAIVFVYGRFRNDNIVYFLALWLIYPSLVSLLRFPDEAFGAILRLVCYWLAFISGPYLLNNYDSRKTLFVLLLLSLLLFIIIDYAAGRTIFINNIDRALGNIGSPIGFAAFCAIVGLLAFSYTRSIVGFVIAESIVFIGLLSTGTRSVTVLILIMLFGMFVMKRAELLRKIMRILVGFFIVFSSLILMIFFTDTGGRIYETLLADKSSDHSTGFRFYIFNIVKEHFRLSDYLFGLGINGFPSWFEHKTGISGIAPHSEVLWLLVELGIIGSLFYFLFLIYAIIILRKKYAKNIIRREEWLLALSLLFAQQFIFQFANPMYFYQVMIIIFMYLGSLALCVPVKLVKKEV